MSKARGLADLGNVYNDGALSNRNLIINGAMQVAQRGTSVTGFTGTNYASLDRFVFEANGGTYTVSQGTSGPSGLPNTFKVEATVTSSTPIVNIQQRIEGGSLQPLGFGTPDAKEVTVSFWVKTNVTGTYTFELYNGDAARQVSKNYTVNSSGTWEYKTITLPADTSSGFDNDVNLSLYVVWWLAAPSTHTSGTQNTSAWASASTANRVSPSIVDISGTVGNYFEITGVQLETGDQATPFEHRSYGDELARCMRYTNVFRADNQGVGAMIATGASTSAGNSYFLLTPQVPMRAKPSTSFSNLIVSNSVNFDAAVTSLGINWSNDRAFYVETAHTSSSAVEKPVNLRQVSYSVGYLILDAEL